MVNITNNTFQAVFYNRNNKMGSETSNIQFEPQEIGQEVLSWNLKLSEFLRIHANFSGGIRGSISRGSHCII